MYQKSFARYNIFNVSEQDHFAMNKNFIKSFADHLLFHSVILFEIEIHTILQILLLVNYNITNSSWYSDYFLYSSFEIFGHLLVLSDKHYCFVLGNIFADRQSSFGFSINLDR